VVLTRLRIRRAQAAAISVLAWAWFYSPVSAQAQAPRTVLTIHWGAEAFPGVGELDAAIRSELLSTIDTPVNYYAEYLETEEFTPEASSAALRDYIRRKFEGRHIDVVIADASAALQFALRYRDELFPGTPIVFVSVAAPEEVTKRSVAGVTGVLRDVAFGETLELALSLHPAVKRAYVIAQAPSINAYQARVKSALDRFSPQVEITFIKESTVAGLLAAVRAIPKDSVILYGRYTPEQAAHVIYPDEIMRLIAEAAPVPVYGPSEVYIGKGIVGGMVRTADVTASRVGQIARDILDGKRPEDIAIAELPTTPTFDWRQLQRWGIDASRLPGGSAIYFKVPTVWETYRAYIVGAIVIVAAQLLLITGLLTQHARRRRAEETILTREASLRTSYEQIRQLAGRLINAQDTARAAIAQDLHDDVCQRLVYVTLAVSSLKSSSGNIEDVNTQKALAELERDTQGVFDGIRKMSHDLHPATLRVLGLAPALKAHCVDVEKRQHVHVTFTAHSDLGHVHPDVAVCFFRIAQEAIRNAIVHGEARRLRVSIDRSGGNLELTVADDGGGFDLEAVRRTGGGLGLVTMEERARVVGAETRIAAAPGRGTTIHVRGPAEPPQPVRLAHAGLDSRSGSAGEVSATN